MPKVTQRDSSDFRAKLALRRHCLRLWHPSEPLEVLDCCAGEQRVWGRLMEEPEFLVAHYTPLDKKHLRGTLSVDSARWLREVGTSANVIDIDTYREPWAHYQALAAGARRLPATVFLTVGKGIGNLSMVSHLALETAGIPAGWAKRMRFGGREVYEFIVSSCLTRLCEPRTIPLDIWLQRSRTSDTRYYGVRLGKGR